MPFLRNASIQATGVHLIKLTQEREVTPYVWVHRDDER
jgi:hypothetical protein